MISFLLIYIVYSSWSQFIKLGNEINYLVFCFLISTIAIIRIIELFKPLRIRENGIYSGNRYTDWSDICGYRWEVVHTDKIEKLIIQSNKKTLFPLLKEFDLKVNIPIKSKKLIEDIICENINASE